MRVRLLADEEHMAAAARLGGIETWILNARDVAELRDAWEESMKDSSVAILILAPTIYRQLKQEADAHRLTGDTPFLVLAPVYGVGRLPGEDER